MNIDIRLSLDFFDHPKTGRLQRICGIEGVFCLQRLWCWAANNRPKGVLAGLDADDIEFTCRWNGERGAFVNALVSVKFLDVAEDGTFVLHNWEQRQAYACQSDERHARAKKAIEARWEKARNNSEKKERRTKEIRKEYSENTDSDSPRHQDTKIPRTPPLSPPEGVNGCVPSESEETAPKLAEPDLEFQEIREWYSDTCRAEGPLDGFAEYIALKKAKQWPGMTRIWDDLSKRSQTPQWRRGFAPGLKNYFRSRLWLAPLRQIIRDEDPIIPPPDNVPEGYDPKILDVSTAGDDFFRGLGIDKAAADDRQAAHMTIPPGVDGVLGRAFERRRQKTEAAG